MAEQRWIPVSEGMPETLVEVLIAVDQEGDPARVTIAALTESGCWLGHCVFGDDVVTHWMPKPSPPDNAELLGRHVFDDDPNAWTDGTMPTPEVLPPPGVPMDAADVRPGVEKVDKLSPAQIDGLLDGLKKKMLRSTGLLVGIQQALIEGEENGWVTCRPGRWTVRFSGYPNMDPKATGPS